MKVSRIHGFTEISLLCLWNWKSPLKKGYWLGHFTLLDIGIQRYFLCGSITILSCPQCHRYIRNIRKFLIHSLQCDRALDSFCQTLLGRNSCFIHCNDRALNSIFPNDMKTKYLLHSLQWCRALNYFSQMISRQNSCFICSNEIGAFPSLLGQNSCFIYCNVRASLIHLKLIKILIGNIRAHSRKRLLTMSALQWQG